jgi:hypothetical protein
MSNNSPEEKEFIHEVMNLLTQLNMRIDMVKKLLEKDNPDIAAIMEHAEKASESSQKLIVCSKDRRKTFS